MLEGAILVSRLHMLPAEKVEGELRYLKIAIDKTAGEAEREAWGWLMAAVAAAGISLSEQGLAAGPTRSLGVSGGGDSTGLTCSPNGASHKLPQAAIHDQPHLDYRHDQLIDQCHGIEHHEIRRRFGRAAPGRPWLAPLFHVDDLRHTLTSLVSRIISVTATQHHR